MEATPQLSVVVVVHNMRRELARTLRSLSAAYQHGIEAGDHELIVVDNGSSDPVDPALVEQFDGLLRIERLDPAPPSPVRAANHGLSLARGELIGLWIDGARLASPGLLAGARQARGLSERAIITAPAFHLGTVTHMRAAEVGYDQGVENELLTRSGWEDDGYRLFEISTPAGSSGRGLFGAMGESSSLFASRAVWSELGGLDERFELPGGGLANHDVYRRACALDGAELIVLLGEGTFHQFHGGAATSRRFTWDEMQADYEAIRGEPHRPPANVPTYLGRVAPPVLPYIEASARQASGRRSEAGS